MSRPAGASRRNPELVPVARSVVAALLAVALLAGVASCAASSRAGREQPSSPPSGRPTDLDPHGRVLLARAAEITDNGVPRGFPHTTLGAVSAAVGWISLLLPRDGAERADVFATIATVDFLRRSEGVVETGYQPPDLPAGSALFFRPLGTRVLTSQPDHVTVALLHASRVSGDRTSSWPLIGSMTWELVWDGDDWRLADLHPTPPSAGLRVPETDSPDAVTAAGWDRFRRA
ncbi:hypothetical protein ACG83_41635 [Frankia sp. R43]|uniref:hypothetical protein n=1 Tax=Frankia sp. R43 TaxID=269536 RepID=UPI0006CA3286|nr:hypothetical protein [Frankia sp. R43]KPM50202.1 hypothetical protein ACG83_41635 [Frankia sp. R43]